MQWHLAPYLKYGKIIHIDVEINNNCNQACLSCWHSQPDNLPFKIETMDHSRVMFWIKKGRDLGAKSIKFNLRGEPLLNKNLQQYIMYANELNYVDIMINTNGVLLTKDMMLQLDKAGLTTCIISVDSFNPNIYCKMHGASLFQFTNLYQNLQDIKGINQLTCKVKLNFHVNKLNKDIQEEALKKEFKGFEIIIRNTMVRHGTDISILNPPKKRKKICPHMMRRLTVTANGKNYPCCMCYDEPINLEIGSPTFIKSIREYFIDDYKAGELIHACIYCKSEEIYK